MNRRNQLDKLFSSLPPCDDELLTIHYVSGFMSSDTDPGKLRILFDLLGPRLYVLANKEDVLRITMWSSDEMLSAKILPADGRAFYSVGFKCGTPLQIIKVVNTFKHLEGVIQQKKIVQDTRAGSDAIKYLIAMTPDRIRLINSKSVLSHKPSSNGPNRPPGDSDLEPGSPPVLIASAN
jgi:hypothetical protein